MSENPFLIGDSMTGGYGNGADILSNCTVAVNKGEIAVIVGPNGAGKSTLLSGLNMRTGKVSIDGEDITNLSPQNRVVIKILIHKIKIFLYLCQLKKT